MACLGLDIGGANLKYVIIREDVEGSDKRAGSEGKFKEKGIMYFPLWKRENLEKLIEKLKVFDVNSVCVVMTAELCDTFKTKEEGVKFIERAVKTAFPETPVFFVSVNGEIKSEAEPAEDFAASNWVASVKFVEEQLNEKEFLFADMGTTTTDLIPFKSKPLSANNDFERLKRRELVYAGILRTPVFHVLKWFEAPLVPEFYSIVGDALVVTGDLSEEDYICETPDGRGVSKEECMQRLARQLCSDLKELGEEFVRDMAFRVRENLLKLISGAMKWQATKWHLKKVVGCGKGEFLLKEAAEKLGLKFRGMSEEIGEMSEVLPAYACAYFAEKPC